ncbi:MAG: CTP-dependent riboflavin kinase [Euryarchaeota archaeon]|nr:CTP-dependent riboflavin kinase [Euryarchaeota archaeon]
MRLTRIKGKVSKGVGEGKYYVNIYSKVIERKLGWKPYPGTINIVVDKKTWETVRRLTNKVIKGFKVGEKEFHDVYYAKCVLKGVPGIIVFPTVSKHGKNIIEVILPEKIEISAGEDVEILVV